MNKQLKIKQSIYNKEMKKYEHAENSIAGLLRFNKVDEFTACECGNCGYKDLISAFLYETTSTWKECNNDSSFKFGHIGCQKCDSRFILEIIFDAKIK